MIYKLTKESIEHEGKKLFRIEYKDGTKGGWLESKSNLSQEGGCRVLHEAKVFGSARVWGNAQIIGEAEVFGFARVYGRAWISNSAKVYGHAKVYDYAAIENEGRVNGYANIFENAKIFGKAVAGGKARVHGNAMITSEDTTTLDLSWVENGKILIVKELRIGAISVVGGEEDIKTRQILNEKIVIKLEVTDKI
jgi:UDP-3-O-[3-hydroxymyristoyl] glucosamine N-acyltransferase